MLAIFLSFALYALYVLLPLVPAVLIYKIFPKTNVTVSGPLSKFSIRATGAFAAYMVTVLLGYFIVTETQVLIRGMLRPTWTIVSEVELVDTQGNQIRDPKRSELLDKLNVEKVNPIPYTFDGTMVRLWTNVNVHDPPIIRYEVPGFGHRNYGVVIGKEETDRWNYTINTDIVSIVEETGEWPDEGIEPQPME